MEARKVSEKDDSDLTANEQGQLTPFDLQEDLFTPPPAFPRPPALDPAASHPPVTLQNDLPSPAESTHSALDTRLGLRFAPNAPPLLLSVFPDAGARFELEADQTLVIGRDPRRCDLVLFNASVSSRHCQLVLDDDDCTLVDLGSSNGTFVNGEKMASRALRQGDLITIGRYVFIFLWHRFTRSPRSEALHYRELRTLLAQLYPTPASIQSLLLASNLFSLPVDLTRGTIEQVWDRVLEQLRKLDVLASLDMMVTCALRDNSASRELLRVREALLAWKSSRQTPSGQDMINADVKNSAYVVREIIENHMGTEEHNNTISQMLDEIDEIEEIKPIGLRNALDERHGGARSAPTPAELPFDLKIDDSGGYPIVKGIDQNPALGNLSRDTVPVPPAALQAAMNVPPAPVASLPPEGPAQAPSPIRPILTATPPNSRQDATAWGNIRTETWGADELAEIRKSFPPSPVPVSSRTDIITSPAALPTPEPDEMEMANNPNVPPAPWDKEPPPRSSRPTWIIAAAACVLTVVVGLGVRAMMNGSADSETEVVLDAAAGGQEGASAQKPAGATAAEKPADSTARAEASDSAAKPAEAAPTAEKPGEAARAEKPATEAGSKNGPALKPAWELINFLDESGTPVYTATTTPAGATWDPDKNQITAASLQNCVWVDRRETKIAAKGNKTFRLVSCSSPQGAAIDGWVIEAGMKKK